MSRRYTRIQSRDLSFVPRTLFAAATRRAFARSQTFRVYCTEGSFREIIENKKIISCCVFPVRQKDPPRALISLRFPILSLDNIRAPTN